MDDFSNSGVYGITNLKNGKLYVGSSADLRRREADHTRALRGGYHPVPYLQNSWNKHGENNFSFVTLENCHPELCVVVEQKWLDKLRTFEFANGYNRSPTAGSTLGFKHTSSTKKKMADRMLGVPIPDWVKEKIRKALTGKAKSAEHRANLWKNRQGWEHSEDSKKKISESLHKAVSEGRVPGPPAGYKHTDEIRAKISSGLRGKPKSAAHRAKIATAVKAALKRKRSGK